MIHVCSLARLQETVEDTGARHVVSLIGDEARLQRPAGVAPENHLWLRLHDISAPLDGYIMPGEQHVAELFNFVRGWDRRALWWCTATWASAARPRARSQASARSTRIATKRRIAQALRRASPTATPNIRIVSLADKLAWPQRPHGRGDRNNRPGVFDGEAAPFRLDLE